MILRPAKSEDALVVAEIHVRSWQAGYRGLLPDEYLDRLRPEDRARVYNFATVNPNHPQTIVAMQDDLLVGFATTGPSREAALIDHAELLALYVDPQYWGRGIGVALVTAARTRMQRAGFRHAMLWLLEGNIRGERFYCADGWSHDGVRKTDVVWGTTVNELRYQRSLATN